MEKIALILDSGAVAVDQAGTSYTAAFETRKCSGILSLLITTSAGSVTVTQQCGLTGDGTFYDPVSSANVALGAIATGFTVGSRFISIDPVATPWSRLKIVEANVAATSFTAKVYETIDT